MATPTAAFRRRLETSPVYEVIPVRQRQTWVSACLALGEDRTRKPQDEEVFEQPDDCWERLFNWSFTRGCIFVKGRHRGGAYLARWYNWVSSQRFAKMITVRSLDRGLVKGRLGLLAATFITILLSVSLRIAYLILRHLGAALGGIRIILGTKILLIH